MRAIADLARQPLLPPRREHGRMRVRRARVASASNLEDGSWSGVSPG
jgi:hypothetical protein